MKKAGQGGGLESEQQGSHLQGASEASWRVLPETQRPVGSQTVPHTEVV